MKKTNLIILAFFLAISGIATSITLATHQKFVDSETQVLLDLQAQHSANPPDLEMLKNLPLLQERDKKINQWIDEYEKMSDKEKQSISDAAQKSYEEQMHLAAEHEDQLKRILLNQALLNHDKRRESIMNTI